MSRLACGHDESALMCDEVGGVTCRLCDSLKTVNEALDLRAAELEQASELGTVAGSAAISLESGTSGTYTDDIPPVTTEWRIRQRYSDLADLAVEKNRSYGDSCLHPLRVLSDLPAEAGIRVRIDDKIGRLQNQPGAFGEDTIKDLIGYLVLLTLAEEDGA